MLRTSGCTACRQPVQVAAEGAVHILRVNGQRLRMMFGPSPREHVIVEHVDDDGGQPSVFLGHDPLAAMNGGVTIRERVDRPVHLDAGAEPLGHALVLEPLGLVP